MTIPISDGRVTAAGKDDDAEAGATADDQSSVCEGTAIARAETMQQRVLAKGRATRT